jgi:hypothetical protein
MRKFQKIQLLGVGVLTPSLVGHPQTAVARPADFTKPLKVEAANASTAELVEMFKREVFALTPAEKIRIAGDRIRLIAQLNNSNQPPARLPVATPQPKMNSNPPLNRQNLRVSVDGDGCTANCAGSRMNMNNNLPLNRQNLRVSVDGDGCTANCAGSRVKSGTQIK